MSAAPRPSGPSASPRRSTASWCGRPVGRSSGSRRRARSCPWTAAGWQRCRASPRRTLPCSAWIPRPPGSRRPRARSRSSSGSAGGRAAASGRSSSCCPTTPMSRPCSPSWRRGSRPTAGSSRTTAGASTGHSSWRGIGWRAPIRRCTRAISTCSHSSAASSATACRMRAWRRSSRSCSGFDAARISPAGRSPAATSTTSAGTSPAPSWTSCATTTRTSARWHGCSCMSTGAMRTASDGGTRHRATSLGLPGRSRARVATKRRSTAWTRRLPQHHSHREFRGMTTGSSRPSGRGLRSASLAVTTTHGGRPGARRTSAAGRAAIPRVAAGTRPSRAGGTRRGPNRGCSPSVRASCAASHAMQTQRPRGSVSLRVAAPWVPWPGSRSRSSASIDSGTCPAPSRPRSPRSGWSSVRRGLGARCPGSRRRSACGSRGSGRARRGAARRPDRARRKGPALRS